MLTFWELKSYSVYNLRIITFGWSKLLDDSRLVWIKKESGTVVNEKRTWWEFWIPTCLESVSKTMSKVNDFGGSWGGAWGFVTATVPVTGFTEVTLWKPLSASSLLSGRIRITTRTFSTSSSKDLLWDLLLFYNIKYVLSLAY